MKLIEEKDKDKRLIQSWMPISLLNVDIKIISKALSKLLRNIFPSLISDNQSTYIYRRFISEGGRLILDVLQTTDVLKLNGLLVTVSRVLWGLSGTKVVGLFKFLTTLKVLNTTKITIHQFLRYQKSDKNH